MRRAAVPQHLESLTDDERDAVAYAVELREAIERGLESARTEPLLDHDAVMAMGRARLAARA